MSNIEPTLNEEGALVVVASAHTSGEVWVDMVGGLDEIYEVGVENAFLGEWTFLALSRAELKALRRAIAKILKENK